jgi:lipoyl(octanoyl) transferase
MVRAWLEGATDVRARPRKDTMSETPAVSAGTASGRTCEVRWLGRVPYAAALALQAALVRQRAAGIIPDQLLLLEHPHVLTLGRNSKAEHVLVDRARLQALGVELFEAGRGGDVTYHGPGQLVAYPILDLAPDRCDLHRYVRDLERALIATLGEYGVAGHAVPGRTGVWVERANGSAAKVAAIGVRVARWITSHGIALNVHTDLGYFDLIVPCGLRESAVTSLGDLAGAAAPPTVRAAGEIFAAHFAQVFDRDRLDAGAEWPHTVEEGVDV